MYLLPKQFTNVRFLELDCKKVISRQFPNLEMDSLPLTESERELVEVRISWPDIK